MTAKVLFRAERQEAPLPARIESKRDLDRWRSEREEGESALRSLTSQRAAMLATATLDAIAKKDTAIATARVRVERATAVIEAAERRIAEEEAREAAKEPERRRRYAAGKKAAAEAERIMREEYGPAARKLGALLSRLADLHAVVGAANADRPEGAAMLDPDAFRGIPAKPGHYETRTFEVTVDEDDQETTRAVRVSGGRSYAPDEGGPAIAVSGHGNPGAGGGMRTTMRERRVYVDPSPAVEAPSLVQGVALPGLAWNDAPFWPPASR